MTYITKELSKEFYQKLWNQGAQAIIDYGWGEILNKGIAEEEDFYKGSFLRTREENNTTKYEIVCRLDEAEEDDLK